jgi:hypothetical protein
MKYLVVLLLFSPVSIIAQDCALKKVKDPYTKEVRISTGFIDLKGALLSIEATKTEIDFMFSINGKCFDDASTSIVFFEGLRQKANYKNSGTMNCEGFFHFTFKNTTSTPSALQNLSVKKITSIRFKDNSKSETEITLTAEQQQMLIDLASCIIKDAKTLLQ